MRSEPAPDAGGSMAASALTLRLLPPVHIGAPPLRIAVLAPPSIPVPPPGYGGIEAVVDLLCGKLVERGHEVTLFAAPGRAQPRACIRSSTPRSRTRSAHSFTSQITSRLRPATDPLERRR